MKSDIEIIDELSDLIPVARHGVVTGVRCYGSIIAAVIGSSEILWIRRVPDVAVYPVLLLWTLLVLSF